MNKDAKRRTDKRDASDDYNRDLFTAPTAGGLLLMIGRRLSRRMRRGTAISRETRTNNSDSNS